MPGSLQGLPGFLCTLGARAAQRIAASSGLNGPWRKRACRSSKASRSPPAAL